MTDRARPCPDCNHDADAVHRREFLKIAGVAAAAAGTWPGLSRAEDAKSPAAETAVKLLYDSLNEAQKKEVCYEWDFQDPKRGHLRTRISNNWHINDRVIDSDFYTNDQKRIIRDIFEGIYHPDWHARLDQQLKDDAGGYGKSQNIAIFGQPGSDKFEFVMTGRH
ncbi:MAG: twin-arginine translocation signal domain-containing protein, partial [Pirellulales bacterium]